LRLRLRGFRTDPEAFLARLVSRWSGSDRRLFARPEVRSFFRADLEAVLLQGQGPAGLVQELRLYQRWGFGLGDIPAEGRVLLWHGKDDVLVPPAMSECVAQHFPGAELTLHPGGHFMVLEHADEVVRRIRSALAESGAAFSSQRLSPLTSSRAT